jgi:hypothetical protein
VIVQIVGELWVVLTLTLALESLDSNFAEKTY